MKKLLILLFSILISFNSYAGILDGKGLKCKPRAIHDDRPMFVWFEEGLYTVPEIVGYRILWYPPHSIDFIGTQEIEFKTPSSASDDLNWWRYKTVDRETLRIVDRVNAREGRCQVITSKQVVIDGLNEEINTAKSINKI